MNDVLQNALVAAFTLRIDRHSSCMSCRVSGWWWDGGGMVVWWCGHGRSYVASPNKK